MLIDLKTVIEKYMLDIKGVIQVGCHWCEEHDIFVGLGINNIVYIEPCEAAFDKAIIKVFGKPYREYDGVNYAYKSNSLLNWGKRTSLQMVNVPTIDDNHRLIMFNVGCADCEGEFEMFSSDNNQGQSNSLLPPNLHLHQHPEIIFDKVELIKVLPLDELFKEKGYDGKHNLLVMDVQGAEGLVLKGATETLKHIDCIYTEINTGETYEGNMLVSEIDELLNEFQRVETYMPSPNWTWGDAIYIRKTLL